MKKIILAIAILSTIALWLYSNDWVVEKNLLDNNETSYTLNYLPHRGTPLFYPFAQIDKAFSIRVMLPCGDAQIEKELKAYYQNKMPKELNSALKSSCNLHNPTLSPMIDAFPLAFKSTSFYKKLEKDLNTKGYWIDKKIDFEKFTIDKNQKSYLFSADIWLKTIPFQELIESAKIVFPNLLEANLKTMFKKGLWNDKKSAVVVYPHDTNTNSIYIFFRNKLDEFMGLDISQVEKMNLGKIGLNLHFDKVETKAVEWIYDEKYYHIKIETKAWLKGKRYRRSEELLIDKNAKIKRGGFK